MKYYWHLLNTVIYCVCLLLFSCGLPTPADSNTIAITAPLVSTYNDRDKFTLTISGSYSSDNFPKFDGFNIYIDGNNEPSSILKRVLYHSKEDSLPTVIHTGSSSESLSLNVEFNKTLKFRFTSSATEEDLNDAKVADRSLLQTRAYRNYEKFNFIVKPVNNGVEGPSSVVATHSFIRFEENIVVKWNQPLKEINNIKDIVLIEDIKFTNDFNNSPVILLSSNIYINTGGQAANIYDKFNPPQDSDSIYTTTHLTPFISNRYYITGLVATIEYLGFYIQQTNNTGVTFSIGHTKEDFITDINK